MANTTITSGEFDRNAKVAKKAAEHGPVFITDSGKPAHVLLSIADYQRMIGGTSKIADLLAMPELSDADLDLRPSRDLAQAADLS